MRREMRLVAVLAIVLLTSFSSGPPAAIAETASPTADPKHCPAGPNGTVTITFEQQGSQCVVAGSVPSVCADRGGSLHWSLVNKDCVFDEGRVAVEISPPKPKAGQKPFQYGGCTPSRKGWKPGKPESIVCQVPKDADVGLYKYDLSGQIKKLDPDIEVRKGG